MPGEWRDRACRCFGGASLFQHEVGTPGSLTSRPAGQLAKDARNQTGPTLKDPDYRAFMCSS